MHRGRWKTLFLSSKLFLKMISCYPVKRCAVVGVSRSLKQSRRCVLKNVCELSPPVSPWYIYRLRWTPELVEFGTSSDSFTLPLPLCHSFAPFLFFFLPTSITSFHPSLGVSFLSFPVPLSSLSLFLSYFFHKVGVDMSWWLNTFSQGSIGPWGSTKPRQSRVRAGRPRMGGVTMVLSDRAWQKHVSATRS